LKSPPRPGVWRRAVLFLAARAYLVERVIRPALDSGQVVIADRFRVVDDRISSRRPGLHDPM